MTCRGVEKALAEDLDFADRVEIQAHIRGCARCAKLSRDLHAMEQLTHLLEERVEIPEGFASCVQRRVSAGTPGLFRRPVFCTCLILLLAGIGLLPGWWPKAGPGTTSVAQLTARDRAEELKVDPLLAETQGPKPAPVFPVRPQVEIILGGGSQPLHTLRLPSEIRVRSTALHDELYLNHASF